MSKSKTAERSVNVMGDAFAMADVGSRAQAYWKVQEAALEHMRSFFEGWYERRRDAAASAADCCAHMVNNGGDLPAASRAWMEWMSGAGERLREDVQAQTTLTTQVASELVGSLAQGGAKPPRRKAHGEPTEENESSRARSTSADVR